MAKKIDIDIDQLLNSLEEEGIEGVEGEIHHGETLKRLRDAATPSGEPPLKQATVASDVLGDIKYQPTVARLEKMRTIKDEILQKFADYYKIPLHILKNIKVDPVRNIVHNTNKFENGSIGNITQGNLEDGSINNLGSGNQIINPLDDYKQACDARDTMFMKLLEKEQERSDKFYKLIESIYNHHNEQKK